MIRQPPLLPQQFCPLSLWGRRPVGGNAGDCSRMPTIGGRFCDSVKIANATPTPALPRCGRWRVLQGRGRIDCGIGNGCLLFRRTAPSLAGRSPQRAGSHAKCVHILRGARGRGGVGVRHVCSVNLSPIHAPICPLPLWGRDGVGFGDAASVFFRPSVCQNHHHRYRACFFTHLQGISAMSPVADDKPTPHPATINPTPALRRVPRKMRPHFSWVPAHRGREPIGGKTGDRSRIPPLGGRFYGSGKMANATPSPALPRCGLRPAREGAERRKCKQSLPMPQPIHPLPCRTRQRPQRGRVGVGVRHVCSVNLSPIHAPICPLPLWGRDGVGFGDAASVFFRPSVCQNHHHRYRACFFTHLQGISAMSPVADDKPTPHPATINPTPALRRVPRKMRPHFSWVPAHRGREPIGGKTGDRSRIPPLGGRFYGSGKMANATPSPALPRCGLRPAREGAERRKC